MILIESEASLTIMSNTNTYKLNKYAKKSSFLIICAQLILQCFMVLNSNNTNLNNIILLLIAGLTIILFIDQMKVVNAYNFIILLVTLVLMSIATILGSGGWGAMVNFIILFLNLCIISQMRFSYKQIKILSITFILFYLIILFCSTKIGVYYVNTDSFNFRINPNIMGYLTLLFAYFSINLLKLKSKKNKISIFKIIIIAIIISMMILSTESRTSLMAFILYIVLIFFGKDIRKNIMKKKKKYRWIGAVIVITFVAVITYSYFLPLYFEGKSIIILGKNIFSGRQVIWAEIFQLIRENWMIGVGSNFAFMNGELYSAHNFFLGFAATFGVPVMACVIILLYRIFKDYYMRNNNINSVDLIYIWICLLIVSIFETVLSYNIVTIFAVLTFIFNTNNLSQVRSEKNDTKSNSLLLVR